MRTTQREALRLFGERGFAGVTVEEIATSSGMATSTVFRHFGTKEGIVIWDEHDAALDEALTEKLLQKRHQATPFNALREVFIHVLAERYQQDLEFQLQRVRFIYQTEALHAAAVEAQLRDRDELSAALRHWLSKPHHDAAPLLAGVAMLALDVAIENWQEAQGEKDLGLLVDQAFTAVENLASLR